MKISIYFIVNNDYQVKEVLDLIGWNKTAYRIVFIKVPHSLKHTLLPESVDHSVEFVPYYQGLKSLVNFVKINSIHARIKKFFKEVTPNDFLFVFTEYEILNQYLISTFAKRTKNIFMLEDGVATVALYSDMNKLSYPLSFKYRLIKFLLASVYGYPSINFLSDKKNFFPIMSDTYFKGICLYFNVHIDRNIQPYLIEKGSKELIEQLDKDSVIFLNEDIYSFYSTYEEYETFLTSILVQLKNGFEKVYFKFHPRETQEYRDRIARTITQIGGIQIILNNDIIEHTISQYRTKYSVAFSSAGCINLFYNGVEPIYLYQLIGFMNSNPIFEGFTMYLNQINYHFIKDLNELNSTYTSGITIPADAMNLFELIEENLND